jgi:hypothetical protein
MTVSISLERRVEVKGLEVDIVREEYDYLSSMHGLTRAQTELQAKVDGLFEEYGLSKDEYTFDLNKLEFVEKVSQP